MGVLVDLGFVKGTFGVMAVSALSRAFRALTLTGGGCKQVQSAKTSNLSRKFTLVGCWLHNEQSLFLYPVILGATMQRICCREQQGLRDISSSMFQQCRFSVAWVSHDHFSGTEQDILEGEKKLYYSAHWHKKDRRPGLDRCIFYSRMFVSNSACQLFAVVVPNESMMCCFISQERFERMVLEVATNNDIVLQTSRDCGMRRGKRKNLLRSVLQKSDMILAGMSQRNNQKQLTELRDKNITN